MNESQKKISEVERKIQQGDFRSARKDMTALLKADNLNETQKIKVVELQRAIESDPLAAAAFGITLFLLIFIMLKYLL